MSAYNMCALLAEARRGRADPLQLQLLVVVRFSAWMDLNFRPLEELKVSGCPCLTL